MTPEVEKKFQEIDENLTCIQHGGGWRSRWVTDGYSHWFTESWYQKCRQTKCPTCDRRAK